MKILSMTATFGKLSHQTLTLKPGLNIIEAPNEWGKSTWCAFLVAMLYGIDTSSRSKKDFLADKERYAPWSGQPMSGRIRLLWQDRDITIERSNKGRIPFGEFQAYETDSQLPIPELTGENCGQQLLGVERDVFTRAGFLRLSDLPVTQDETLRRRLNALVTTADESGASDTLSQKLKDLKNRCRHNRTGELPQVETQLQALENKLRELDALQGQCQMLSQEEAQLARYTADLKNHQAALAYQRAQQTQAHLEAANAAFIQAEAALTQQNTLCKGLPDKQTATQELQRLSQLQQQWAQLQQQSETLPDAPQPPQAPQVFAGMTPAQAAEKAQSDRSAYDMLCKPISPLFLILAVLFAAGALAAGLYNWLLSLPLLAIAAGSVGLYLRNRAAQRNDREAVARPYGNSDPAQWVMLAEAYMQQHRQYEAASTDSRTQQEHLAIRKESLRQSMDMLTGGQSLSDCLARWTQVLALRDEQQDCQRLRDQAFSHLQALQTVAVQAPPPEYPDALTLTPEQTELALQQTTAQRRMAHQRLGQCQGQMEALGSREVLQRQLQQLQLRHHRLEETYAALTLAQQTLTAAATELQRRFAPQISGKAQALFSRLTGNRYDRVNLGADLSLSAASAQEDTLHGILWRSEGTADQLYLALRLAVARELTPEAPLVLDDALVRFDDDRMAEAVKILREMAKEKQILLFTCQGREKRV